MTEQTSRNGEGSRCMLSGRKCYLAGPMRGYPQYNFPAFFAAAKSLRERGIEVWSPAEHDVHADGFNPETDTAQPMRHYMKRDLPAVLDADFIAVLPGWERSQGACLEVHVARTCGIPVLDAETLAEVGFAQSERRHTTPEGWVVVPRELTAENGMKAALSGEFFVRPSGQDFEFMVPWHTLKEIHRAMVKEAERSLAHYHERKEP